MKTDCTLRLGRAQYRRLAESVKAAGCCLGVTPFHELRVWGLYDPFAAAVHADATADDVRLHEKIVIQLAATVDTAQLRATQRPELDWSQLEDSEIYEFITQHEIGHHIDNHNGWDIFKLQDLELRNRCERVIRSINEVLADRFAWSFVRPGEPIPLSESGKRMQEDVEAAMALLDLHVPRTRRAPQALPSGQYAYVPSSMLETRELAAFVGPRVAPGLIQRASERRRVYRRDTRSRAYA